MILDTTTKNTVYSTIGPQAQWYRHRWGERDYPILDLDISAIPDNPIYHLACIYGDPADWKHINKFIKTTDKTLFIDTYGMFKDSTLTLLSNASVGFIRIRIDGWTKTMGKVFLGQQLDRVMNSIEILKAKIKLEYSLYRHNQCDVEDFKNFCKSNNIDYTISNGEITDDGLSCIINSAGEWLYDIHPVTINDNDLSYDVNQLHKTAMGAERLKTYLSDPPGRGILDYPIIPNMSNVHIPQEIKDKYTENSAQFVACTGMLFDSINLGQLFMMLLASDWKFSVLDLPKLNDYEKSILYGASILSAMVQQKQ